MSGKKRKICVCLFSGEGVVEKERDYHKKFPFHEFPERSVESTIFGPPPVLLSSAAQSGGDTYKYRTYTYHL